MNKFSTHIRVFVVLEMAKCHENVKAVQRVWEEEFHNWKNWPDKRTINVCSHVMDGFQNRLTAVLVKEGERRPMPPYLTPLQRPSRLDGHGTTSTYSELSTWDLSLTKPAPYYWINETFTRKLDLQKVQEVRIGKNSKAFERWPEETRKFQNNECFIILYGNSFILKSLSCIAKKDEFEMLVKSIRHLAAESTNAPYPLLVERWLCKEFYCMENLRGVITIKDLKAFLPKINLKLATNRLKEFFQDVDAKRIGEIDFEGFASLYYNLIHDEQLFDGQHAKDGPGVTLYCFQNFLLDHQKDPDAADRQKVSLLMREHLQDPIRDAQEPFFTVPEFIDFLFSKQNDAWDTKHNEVNQDMTQPLVNYWIASSHNTYLTGDQVKSESSTEAYARCLRMGCRCIELDCWDGPDNMPRVYHGRTLTSKIRFIDVLRTIREHAFVTSEYPVILSIENHCSLPQQRNMAVAFLEVLGDMLLVEPIERDGTHMPSPAQLKRRIIIKHKKPPDEHEEEIILQRDEGIDVDISNAVKNGILYLEDPVDHEKWRPHFFMLTQNKMYYTEVQSDEDEDNEDSNTHTKEDIPNEEIDFGEEWFHGKLPGGYNEAEELLHQYYLGEGSFLVHESEIFVGDYSLSFWRQGTVHHCHIKSRLERGQTKYFLTDAISFDNLHSLITYYQSHQLRSSEFSMCLTEPVPWSDNREGMEWFHSNMTRAQAEEMLKKVPYDGAYLVRPSEKEENSFAISFRAENKIKHCRIKQDGRLYTIGTAQFVSLVELVNYYEKHTLYRKVKLKYPVNEQVVHRISGVGYRGTGRLTVTLQLIPGIPTVSKPLRKPGTQRIKDDISSQRFLYGFTKAALKRMKQDLLCSLQNFSLEEQTSSRDGGCITRVCLYMDGSKME
ncbi:1-phosphatidylinositol 4,5-bisphosphate phosphodiesterase gamma-1 [Araneus ventricosus]|uniref:Phosphoinositide phospholipase C n=1 Tax=Araneus ventricosus TaxID=182803 RepID=A0A4Y2PCX6_ARAVE|nr:1-phosphatidylinositol 4,5-bisphosphate phosphodiesterase gamma-1 [Araneus ventricosus]